MKEKKFAAQYRNIVNTRLYYLNETGINLLTRNYYGYSDANLPVNTLIPPKRKNITSLRHLPIK